jgi:hypothetical protein
MSLGSFVREGSGDTDHGHRQRERPKDAIRRT